MRTEPCLEPASPPADAIRTRDAIALLAGKALKTNSTAYIRHQGRLARGAEHGRLTEYRQLGPGGVPRHPRYYSRAEVLALRDSLERDGFTAAAPSAYQRRTVQAIINRAEREGLIDLAAAAQLARVGIAAARKWTQLGRFGACKIDGLWFFDRAQVGAYHVLSTEAGGCALTARRPSRPLGSPARQASARRAPTGPRALAKRVAGASPHQAARCRCCPSAAGNVGAQRKYETDELPAIAGFLAPAALDWREPKQVGRRRRNDPPPALEGLSSSALGDVTESGRRLPRLRPAALRRHRPKEHRMSVSILPAPVRTVRLGAVTLDAIDAVNIAVGEFALALKPDDPRGTGLHLIQDGLDELWRVSGGPHLQLQRAAPIADRLAAALDQIGHQSSPVFRDRLAGALEAGA